MTLFLWIKQILGKWIWILGFTPLVLDYISTYVPSRYIPTMILRLIKEGANWQLTTGLIVIGLLISAFLVHKETKKELEAKIDELKRANHILLSESISENSIDLSHFSTSSYNAIELKYVTGNEPIKVSLVTITYLGSNEESKKTQVDQFFSLSGPLLADHHTNLSVLNVSEGVRFHTISKDDTKNEYVTINISFSGVKSGKNIELERRVSLKPNNIWYTS